MITANVFARIVCIIAVSSSCSLASAQIGSLTSENRERPIKGPESLGEKSILHDAGDEIEHQKAEVFTVSDGSATVTDQADLAESPTSDWEDECVAEGYSRCCNNPCPSVYGQVEALFLQREPRFARQAIVVDPNTDTTFLSTSDLDSDIDPGVRATIGMRICGGRALEFTYFGLGEGSASAFAESIDPADFLIFPDNFFGNAFVDPDSVGLSYASTLNSFELNLPCCCGCCERCGNGCGDPCGCGEMRCRSSEWFGGFRYINVDEELHISAQRIVAGGLEEGSYDIRTTNNLYGVQLGMRERRTRGRFGWEATGKVGVFGNDARQVQSATDFPDFQIRPTVSSTGGQVAFIGDTNLSALYRLTDVWNLRAGYNLIWIEGLALAPDQLDFDFASADGGSQLHRGGGLFLHGVNVGVEARW